MTVTPWLLSGAGVGAGVWVLLRACRPRPVAIDRVLADMDRPGRSLTDPPRPRPELLDAFEGVARRLAEPFGLADRQADLAVVDRSAARHAVDQLATALATLFAAAVVVFVVDRAGVHLPLLLVLAGCAVVAFGGWWWPVVRLKAAAEEQRRAFRHAASGYLDLVNVLLAGGAGLESALWAAAEVGDGWSWERLRGALHQARLTGRAPWDVFQELGQELAVSELSELAANTSLAGTSGARIRDAIAAQADTMRGRQLAELEVSAESATERMILPVSALLAGFLILIAYPAVQVITMS